MCVCMLCHFVGAYVCVYWVILWVYTHVFVCVCVCCVILWVYMWVCAYVCVGSFCLCICVWVSCCRCICVCVDVCWGVFFPYVCWLVLFNAREFWIFTAFYFLLCVRVFCFYVCIYIYICIYHQSLQYADGILSWGIKPSPKKRSLGNKFKRHLIVRFQFWMSEEYGFPLHWHYFSNKPTFIDMQGPRDRSSIPGRVIPKTQK